MTRRKAASKSSEVTMSFGFASIEHAFASVGNTQSQRLALSRGRAVNSSLEDSMRMRKFVVGLILAAAISLGVACVTPTWVTTAIGIAQVAVPIAGSIVDIIDPALAPIVTLVENGFSALVNTLNSYKASPTTTNLQAVEAALAAVNANIKQLETAAAIKNPKTDAQIEGIIQLLSQAVTNIAALVPAPVAAKAKVSAIGGNGWTADDFKNQFDIIVNGDPRFHKM
jgi:hypothetical protein